MLFYIIDSDEAVRSMLGKIIEDEELGVVVGEAENRAMIDGQLLILKKVDIVFIDPFMPNQDGIETIHHIGSAFTGKYIMISQIKTKKLIAEAYSLGAEYCIIKPIDRLEVLSVTKKVMERIRLEKSIRDIHNTLGQMLQSNNSIHDKQHPLEDREEIIASGRIILSELGVIGESGSKDLLNILDYLVQNEKENTLHHSLPPLKEIFASLAQNKCGPYASTVELKREIKASQQRVRRTIHQALNHLASLGLTDFSNPTFEHYSRFFDFTVIRQKMTELSSGSTMFTSQVRISTAKFIRVLYYEAKQ